jgi:predicted outer membrane protein
MSYKLTLSVDKSTADFAKEYAKEMGVSVTFIVENLFKSLASKKKVKLKKEQLSDELKGLIGIAKLPEDFDWKKDKLDRLSKKYDL